MILVLFRPICIKAWRYCENPVGTQACLELKIQDLPKPYNIIFGRFPNAILFVSEPERSTSRFRNRSPQMGSIWTLWVCFVTSEPTRTPSREVPDSTQIPASLHPRKYVDYWPSGLLSYRLRATVLRSFGVQVTLTAQLHTVRGDYLPCGPYITPILLTAQEPGI